MRFKNKISMVVKAYFTVHSRILQNQHFCFSVFVFRCTHCRVLLHSPWSRVILQKLTSFQLVKKFPAFYGTRSFITAFTSARHLSLSWARSSQFIAPLSHSPKIYLNSILSSTPGSPKWSLSLNFPHQNPVYAFPLPHTRYMPRPSHSSRFYHPNNNGWGVQVIQLLIILDT